METIQNYPKNETILPARGPHRAVNKRWREKMSPAEQILVLDDDVDVGEFITAAAQKLGLPCTASSTAAGFLKALTPDTTLVLMDLMMPQMDGIELLRLLGDQQCKAEIILMSGTRKRIIETAEQFARSIGLTVIGHLQKPFRLADLESALKKNTPSTAKPASQQKPALVISDTELRSAIERDEFVLHYQPQIDLTTGRVIGLEALVRWQHPQQGLIFPDNFITRMEALGLIDQLGWLVVDRSLGELGLLADENGAVPLLSINVSVHSLLDLKFPDTYLEILKKHRVAAKDTILEITESGLIKKISTTLDVLTRLRLHQVQLSIDDFGTGYSMMQQLRNIPATEIKIDKSFVQNIHGTQSDLVMVQKTIEIGHALGMKVVGEGVETQEQLDLLYANGCDIVQGYFFSRPLPLKDMQAWLRMYRLEHAA
jgi:EAL domain-containing protein (putative c-di-GMP-specific phosphodiesterase class I)/ActR/RegA family two-component response regulator